MTTPLFAEIHSLARRKSTPFDKRLECIALLADRTPDHGIAYFIPAAEREALQITSHLLLELLRERASADDANQSSSGPGWNERLHGAMKQLGCLLERMPVTEPVPLPGALADVLVFALQECRSLSKTTLAGDQDLVTQVLEQAISVQSTACGPSSELSRDAPSFVHEAEDERNRWSSPLQTSGRSLMQTTLSLANMLLERHSFQPSLEALMRLLASFLEVRLEEALRPSRLRSVRLPALMESTRSLLLKRLEERHELGEASIKRLGILFGGPDALLGQLSLALPVEPSLRSLLMLLMHRALESVQTTCGMDGAALGTAYAHWIGQKLLGLEQDKTVLELEHTSAAKDHSSEDQDEQRRSRLGSVSDTAVAASAAQCFRLGAETLQAHMVALFRRKTLLPIRDASSVLAKSETGRKRAWESRSNSTIESMVLGDRQLESDMVGTLQRMRSAYLITCLSYLVSWQAASASAWRWMWTSILTDAWRLRLYTRSDAEDPVLSKRLSGLLHRLIPLAIERGLRPILFTRITTEPFHTAEVLSRCFLDECATCSAVDAFRMALVATLATHRASERLWQMLLDLCAETGQVVRWSPALERTMTNTVSTRWTRTQCWSMFQRLVYAFHRACALTLPRGGDDPGIQGWVSQPVQAKTSPGERDSPSQAVWSLLPLLVACAESTTGTTTPLPDLNDAAFHEAFRACWQWSRHEQPARMPDLARVALALLQLHLAARATPSKEFKTLVELCKDWQPETDTTNGLLLEYRQRTMGDRYETLRTFWPRRRSRVIPELRWRTLEWAQAALRVAQLTTETILVHAVFEMVPEHPEIVSWFCKDVDIWDIRTGPDSCATDPSHVTTLWSTAVHLIHFLASMDMKLLLRPSCLRLLTAIPQLPDGDVLASTLDLLFSRLLEAFAHQSLAPDIVTRLCWSIVHLRHLDETRAARPASVSVKEAAEAAFHRCLTSRPLSMACDLTKLRFHAEPFLDTLLTWLSESRVLALLETRNFSERYDTWLEDSWLLLVLARVGRRYPRLGIHWSAGDLLAQSLAKECERWLGLGIREADQARRERLVLFHELSAGLLRGVSTLPADCWRILYLHGFRFPNGQVLAPAVSFAVGEEAPRALGPYWTAYWHRLVQERWEIPTELPSLALMNALVTALTTLMRSWQDSQSVAQLLLVQQWIEQLVYRLPRRAIRFLWELFERGWLSHEIAPEPSPAEKGSYPLDGSAATLKLGPARTALLLTMTLFATALLGRQHSSSLELPTGKRAVGPYLERRLVAWLTTMDAQTLAAVSDTLLLWRFPEQRLDGSIADGELALLSFMALVERLVRRQRASRDGQLALTGVAKAVLVACAKALFRPHARPSARFLRQVQRFSVALVDRHRDPRGTVFHPVLALALRATLKYSSDASLSMLWYAFKQHQPRLLRLVAPLLIPVFGQEWARLRQESTRRYQEEPHDAERVSLGVAMRNLRSILYELWELVDERARLNVYALTPASLLSYIRQLERDYNLQQRYRGLG